MNMLGLRDLILIAQTPSLHHHHHHHNQNQPIPTDNNNSNLPLPSSAASLSVGFGIFPLLTATPCIPQPQNQNNDVQESSAPTNNNNNYWNLRMCPEVNNTSPKKGSVINFDNDDEKVVVMSESEENGIYGAEYRVCQDCGNRAKKDCVFRRCRTCCKGRGYHCTTHVKSTWIPSVRRREREVAAASGGGGGDGGVKRPRSSQNVTTTSHSSNSNATTSKNFATSSCHQDAGFKESLPGHVKAPAVFRCHRVTAVGNGEDEFAYLATVHISGHVFKGFLYDHGVGEKNAMPCVSELQLGNNNCSGRKNGECSSAIGINNNNNNAYPASAS